MANTHVKNKGGRPPTPWNPKDVENLYGLQCTDEEVAAFFEVTKRTVMRWKLQKKFAEAAERGKSKGRISLRRSMWQLAQSGNATMNVWLSKNVLGYRDDPGPDGHDAHLPKQPASEWLEQRHRQRLLEGGNTNRSPRSSDSTTTPGADSRDTQGQSVLENPGPSLTKH